MKIHHFTVDEALQSLHSSYEGLASVEARRRLVEFGPNRIEPLKGTPLIYRFAKSFVDFFALILWVAAGLAFIAEYYDPGSGMAKLGFAVLAVILVNALFTFWQEFRVERALAALQKLLPHQVKAFRDGKVHPIPAEELVAGDVILLDDGDNVPADCRITEAFGVRVNNATVTGESLPQSRDKYPSNEDELLHSRNVMLAGTSVVSGQARAVVFATGMHTEFGRIAHLSQRTRQPLAPLQHEIKRLSRLIAILSTILGVVFFLIGRTLGFSFWQNFLFAIGIIVANVPEGLLPTVTLALALGSQRMAKRKALIRHLPSVETLGSVTVICTDKTGTLTENRMAVKEVFLSGRFQELEDFCSSSSLKAKHRSFLKVARHCHTLKETESEGKKALLGDPMEVALVQMARRCLGESAEFPQVDEVPFDSDRKRLSTLRRTPGGLVLYTKGALESLLPLCCDIEAEASIQPLNLQWKEELLHAQNVMAEDGLRVLALARRAVPEGYDSHHLEENLVLCGLVGLEDPPRQEVPEALRRCREAGIRVVMITGDHPRTAVAVARQIGLVQGDSPTVITGDRLRRISNTQLQLALRAEEIVFARVGADQKMRVVNALQAQKEIVAVTGDGVNDAPALRQADIGIAMGLTGTDVAREAADMVLLDDNFANIVAAVEEGRAVFANIRKFFTYILTHNIPELVPYLACVLFKIPPALTVIQILSVDLGTDMLPAVALGAEKPEPDAMHKPPRSRNQRLVDWGLLARAYLFLGLLEAVAAMAAFFFVLASGGWTYEQDPPPNHPLYVMATTACLSTIILMQVANVFLCRGERASAFSFSPFSNGWLMAGIVVEVALILLIDYTSAGNWVFGTSAIPVSVWLFMLPFVAVMLVLEELRKWYFRCRRAGVEPHPTVSNRVSLARKENRHAALSADHHQGL